MPVLTTPGELSAAVRRARRLFLFFDYDGTLVPIAPTPEQARPDRGLLDILNRLVAAPGVRVAVVSGRELPDLINILPVHGLYLAGCHGAELRRPDGEMDVLCPDAYLALAEAARRLRLVLAGRRGFLLEEKKYSLALHYRLADPAEVPGVLEVFRQTAGAAARRHGLAFTPGKKVLELRSQSVCKGAAVTRLLDDHPGALPVYLGDDITDESAFTTLAGWKTPPAGSDAANQAEYETPPVGRDMVMPAERGGFRIGEKGKTPASVGWDSAGVSVQEKTAPLNGITRGCAITVLVSTEPHPSAARYRLPDTAAVARFLGNLV